MGTSNSRLIDNVEWVKNHDIPRHDVNEAFHYVAKNHPYLGCATIAFPILDGSEDIETLAKYADAVTVACSNIIPVPSDVPDQTIIDMNETAVANVAYIFLYGPMEARNTAGNIIERWRKLKSR